MKAAILEQAGSPLVIGDLAIANPGPHEVLIRTAACGLCHSDLHFIDGAYPHPLPAVPGHEAAGIVEAIAAKFARSRSAMRSLLVSRPSAGTANSALPDGCRCAWALTPAADRARRRA